jgi:hypothetical protein
MVRRPVLIERNGMTSDELREIGVYVIEIEVRKQACAIARRRGAPDIDNFEMRQRPHRAFVRRN